ncbi:MAG TPA: hypothetical protein VFU43_28670 [Streptosporangiaceae bacterium]|nr:hypothetical protein [Streptosporangiaceae bacterium]
MKAPVRPRLARVFFTIVLILFGVGLAVSACVHQTKTAGQAGEQASAPPAPTATVPTPGTPSRATPPSRKPPAPFPRAVATPRLPAPYLPLWPFANGRQVRDWEAGYRSGGHQPWHLSAQQTALAFTRGYLGYTEVNRVAATTISGRHARVAVGSLTDAGRVGTAGVIHLVRFGSGSTAPWEVVGTEDLTLSLTTPAYGARITTGKVVVGGRITGVDESIRVQARQLSSTGVIGEFCCVSAGDQNQPWSATVTIRGGPGVITIAAYTGGHLKIVERFAVTGVVR